MSKARWVLVRSLSCCCAVILVAGRPVEASAQTRKGEAPALTTPATATTKVYEVSKAERIVLIVRNEPGPLASTALPPPHAKPVLHPFLSGEARAPEEEGALRGILEQSKDFPDFIDRLGRAGYTLRELAPP
jgi:hypothetical protein